MWWELLHKISALPRDISDEATGGITDERRQNRIRIISLVPKKPKLSCFCTICTNVGLIFRWGPNTPKSSNVKTSTCQMKKMSYCTVPTFTHVLISIINSLLGDKLITIIVRVCTVHGQRTTKKSTYCLTFRFCVTKFKKIDIYIYIR